MYLLTRNNSRMNYHCHRPLPHHSTKLTDRLKKTYPRNIKEPKKQKKQKNGWLKPYPENSGKHTHALVGLSSLRNNFNTDNQSLSPEMTTGSWSSSPFDPSISPDCATRGIMSLRHRTTRRCSRYSQGRVVERNRLKVSRANAPLPLSRHARLPASRARRVV